MPDTIRKKTARIVLVIFIALAILLSAGCGRPFNVKTNIKFPAAEPESKYESPRIAVRAVAIIDEAALLDTFDANLLLAGLLAVRVEIENRADTPLDIRRARFELSTSSGRALSEAQSSKAYKRLISYYGVSAYNVAGYKQSLADFASYAIDQQKQISPGDARHGLIFFRFPADLADLGELLLVVKGLGGDKAGRIELKLGHT
ncbi:MAG TPA: hypothetical protein VKM94_06285 [Blastocatellia bacterium]|nr:hypothetical protein [Blastocatellia bacterium]